MRETQIHVRSYCLEYGNAWSSFELCEKLQLHFLLDRVAKFTSLRPDNGWDFAESLESPTQIPVVYPPPPPPTPGENHVQVTIRHRTAKG